jgi:hypothetical protein
MLARSHPGSLGALLAELPAGLRAAIDTTVFARLGDADREVLRRISEATGAHVVAYDLRVAGDGLALCTAVAQAYLAPAHLAALRAAERELPGWIALVAYARPAELRGVTGARWR